MEWIIATVLVIIGALAVCFLCTKKLSNRAFRCKSCAKEFTVSWTKLLFAVHTDDYYEIKCPFCGHKGCKEKHN